MKKAETISLDDDLRPEYKRSDFKKLERGKYYERLKKSSNVVILNPEVAKAFPDSESVNAALLGLLELARSSTRPRRSSGRG